MPKKPMILNPALERRMIRLGYAGYNIEEISRKAKKRFPSEPGTSKKKVKKVISRIPDRHKLIMQRHRKIILDCCKNLRIKLPAEVIDRLNAKIDSGIMPNKYLKITIFVLDFIRKNPDKTVPELMQAVNAGKKGKINGKISKTRMEKMARIAFSEEEKLQRAREITKRKGRNIGDGRKYSLETTFPYIVRAIETYSDQGFNYEQIRRQLRFTYGKEHDHSDRVIQRYLDTHRTKQKEKHQKN